MSKHPKLSRIIDSALCSVGISIASEIRRRTIEECASIANRYDQSLSTDKNSISIAARIRAIAK